VVVLLDTATLAPGRRADAVAEIMRFSSSIPTQVIHNCPSDEVSALFEYSAFGDQRLLTSTNSAQGLVRTAAQLKGAESGQLAVSVKWTGTASHTHVPGGRLRGGDLFVADLRRPYEFFDSGGVSSTFYIPFDRLGLPPDYAFQAGQRLNQSPMAQQLRRHFQLLLRDADAIAHGPAAAIVGQATTELIRAALVAAVDEEPFRADGWEQSLITVVKSYIAQHLADPELGAETIAQATFISVRQLYKLWEAEPRSLGQWILFSRLDAARRELTTPRRRHQTIAAIARHCGFVDATHFSRRFRQAYGMSPREWRRACLSGVIPIG
jgi:AraC-like DNA-binding protein